MAISSTFSFTNNTEMSNVTVKPVDLKPTTLYGVTEDTATSCCLANKTCKSGRRELLSYQGTDIPKVSTRNTILNPGKVTSGRNVIVRLDEVLTTEDGNGAVIQDDPIVLMLQIRTTNSPYVSADHISQCFKRLVGACMTEDGAFRFNDLLMSALRPTTN